MTTNLVFGIADNSNERGVLSIPVATATPGNYATIQGLQGDIALNIAALSLGVLQTQTISTPQTLSRDKADDVWANRELAVRFVLADASLNQASVSLPAPDLAKFPFNDMGSDVVNWPYPDPDTDVTAFVINLEGDMRHPISGAAVTLVRIELVGRNN
jgi:hypothetical protein